MNRLTIQNYTTINDSHTLLINCFNIIMSLVDIKDNIDLGYLTDSSCKIRWYSKYNTQKDYSTESKVMCLALTAVRIIYSPYLQLKEALESQLTTSTKIHNIYLANRELITDIQFEEASQSLSAQLRKFSKELKIVSEYTIKLYHSATTFYNQFIPLLGKYRTKINEIDDILLDIIICTSDPIIINLIDNFKITANIDICVKAFVKAMKTFSEEQLTKKNYINRLFKLHNKIDKFHDDSERQPKKYVLYVSIKSAL